MRKRRQRMLKAMRCTCLTDLGRRAFTLIELLVVIVILGILMAVAVPTFLKQQSKAQDSRTQQYLTTAYKAIRTSTPENGNAYPSSTSMVSWIKQSEPELTAQRGSCTNGVQSAPPDAVLVDTASTANALTLCARSQSGNVWKLTASATGVQQLLDGTLIPLTFTGNEITDTTRAAGVQGDGLSPNSSTGVWETTTNTVLRSYFDGTIRATTPPSGWFTGNSAGNTATLNQVSDSSFLDGGVAGEAHLVKTGSGWAYVAAAAPAPYSTSSSYTVSFDAKLISGTGQIFVIVEDSDGTNVVMPSRNLTITNTKQRYSFTFTPLIAGNNTVVFFGAQSNPSDETFRVGSLQVEKTATATPYVQTNGAAVARAAGGIRAPASLLSATQGWIAIRTSMQAASTVPGNRFLFSWDDGTNQNRYAVYWDGTAGTWSVRREAGGSFSPISVADTYSAGTHRTVILSWGSFGSSFSLNGGAFQTDSQTYAPSGLQSTFNIGKADASSTGQMDGNILWFACGTGTLSNADAATIGSWGDNDPARSSFPSSAQATMVWNGASTSGSLK